MNIEVAAPFGLWATLPLLAWAMVAALFVCSGAVASLRAAALFGAAAVGPYLVLSTEALSLAAAIDRGALIAVWGVPLPLLAVLLRRYRTQLLRDRLTELRDSPALRDPFVRACVVALAALLLTLLVIALAAPPNTWDSMTYHMGRVAHWIQNRSVAHYPTSIDRQLFMNPGAEMVILHLQVLSGGDRFANLPQWCAAVGSVIGVSMIARQLGGGARTQCLAAVVAATLPMGILQSSSTQNDYVETFWLVTLVVLGLEWAARGGGWRALTGGAALGMAVLTKPSSYFYAPSLLAWLLLRGILQAREQNEEASPTRRGSGMRWLVPEAAIALAAAAVLTTPHFARNVSWYGTLLGPSELESQRTLVSPAALASNVVRNFAIHIETQVPAVDRQIQRAIEVLHEPLGISANDPRTTFEGTVFKVAGPSLSEDTTGNPLHLALLLFAVAAACVVPRVRSGGVLGYGASLLGGFLLFCLLLRWQPWHSRLQLPLFVLSAPLVATLLTRAFAHKWTAAIGAVLLVASLPWVLIGDARPLLGSRSVLTTPRAEQYFRNRPELAGEYVAAAEPVARSGCNRVGLALGGNDWEYPIWVLLHAESGPGVRIGHVRWSEGPAQDGIESPCAVVGLDETRADLEARTGLREIADEGRLIVASYTER